MKTEIEKIQKKFKEAVENYAKEQSDVNWYALQGIFNEAMVVGKIEGLNDARIMVWGFGFDNDKTASYIKRNVYERMKYLSEPYDLRDQIRREEDTPTTPNPPE
jgi:arabinogalactan endo-1,4-beta-galactosidase